MDVSWIVGHHRTTFHSSEDTVSLPTRSGEAVNLRELCETTVPPCWLNPLLFNGHLQTMATALNGGDVPIYYKRKLFEAEDLTYAGTFAVDFVTAPYGGSDGTLPPRTTYFTDEEFASVGSEDSRPMLVCLHGLSGGSYELYLRECLAPLVSKMGGWEACVVNSRGCAMSKITSQILYNARATWDIRQTMKWLRKKFPNRLFFGLGFSLGANILTNVRLSYELNCKGRLN
jgi:predicted alpha/beta-fold hydrolase